MHTYAELCKVLCSLCSLRQPTIPSTQDGVMTIPAVTSTHGRGWETLAVMDVMKISTTVIGGR